MFNADPKTLARVARNLDRVLVADPNPAAGKLLSDLVKDCGGRNVMVAREQARAAELAREFDPQIIFIELAGAGFDGLAFMRALRRSDYVCRKSPAVMVTAEATIESIKAARDSGVHEFLRKPYTTRDLFRRIEAATLKPRDWIEAKMYVGPDRRRFNSAEFEGDRKRQSDQAADNAANAAAGGAFPRALSAIAAALADFNAKPQAALRAMLEQAAELQSAAFHYADPDLTAAVGSLQRYLLQALEIQRLSRRTVEDHAALILMLSQEGGPGPDERRRMVREIATRAASEQSAASRSAAA